MQAAKQKQTAVSNQTDSSKKERPEAADSKKQAQLGAIQSMSDTKRNEMIQRTEAQIAMAEAELKYLEHQMNDPAVQMDPVKSQEIADEYSAKENEIMGYYEKWEQLTEA